MVMMLLPTPQKMEEEILAGPSARANRAPLFVRLPHLIGQSEVSELRDDARQLRFPRRLRDCEVLHEDDYARGPNAVSELRERGHI
jgi:hypothetical protein